MVAAKFAVGPTTMSLASADASVPTALGLMETPARDLAGVKLSVATVDASNRVAPFAAPDAVLVGAPATAPPSGRNCEGLSESFRI